ncbi:MAG TPA: hypothetical protein VFL91_09280, partial [Thermomicrobiales bacterium]|nr:hypothetical protein [Thermomicrobiales bacterium]
TAKGTNNLAVWDNLAHQAAQFQVLLQGSYFWFLGGIYADHLLLPIFLVSTAGLLTLVCGVREYRRYRAAALFLLTMLAAIYVLSAFTLSGLETTHLLIMLPLPQLVVAAFVALLGRSLARLAGRAAVRGNVRRALRAAALALPILALIVPPVAADLRVDRDYHQALAATGGKSSFSASIYDLAIFLDRFDYTRPYALDWGMKYNVELLTHGRVQPQEIYGQSTDLPPDFDATLDRLFQDPNAVFLAHRVTGDGVPAAYPGRVEELQRLAAAENKNVVVLKVIYESGGAPLFYVYSVRDRR